MPKKKEKSPAYQWYPKDILTDKKVMRMTLEQEAVYRRLLDYCWLENGLDNDVHLLASYSKLNGQIEKFKSIWKVVKKCFYLDKKKWKNWRQNEERKKQKTRSALQSKRAKGRWDKQKKGDAEGMPPHNLR